LAWAACSILWVAACGHAPRPGLGTLATVPHVDLDRYLGTWYEIARYPHRFQAGCVASMARYTRNPDGRIRVENECREGELNGRLRRATGVAQVATTDPSNAKLEVEFFWPFRGAYWIIELDPDYQYAVVGHPSREYLWILARRPEMQASLYHELLRRIAAHGYELVRIQRTLQSAE
jgi:apolipoprotein D and lipocalin family protein